MLQLQPQQTPQALPLQVPGATAGPDPVEHWLANGLAQGQLSQAEHDARLRMHRARLGGATATVAALPTRTLSNGRKQIDGRGQWERLAGPFQSYAQALQARTCTPHGSNRASWMFNDKSGKKSYCHCNYHQDAEGNQCPVQLKVVKAGEAEYYLAVTHNVEHALFVKCFVRKNSSLTREESVYVAEETAKFNSKPKDMRDHLQWLALQHGCRKRPGLDKGVEGTASSRMSSPSRTPVTPADTDTLHAPPIMATGVTQPLAAYQRASRLARAAQCGKIDCTNDLRGWAQRQPLPASLQDLRDNMTYCIPMDYGRFDAVDAVLLTGRSQVLWILQLLCARGRWALHMDGKHKLHHGDWILFTFGSHAVEQRRNSDCKSHASKVVHSFRPLVYMFSKGHEDEASILFGMKGLEVVARMCPSRAALRTCTALHRSTSTPSPPARPTPLPSSPRPPRSHEHVALRPHSHNPAILQKPSVPPPPK